MTQLNFVEYHKKESNPKIAHNDFSPIGLGAEHTFLCKTKENRVVLMIEIEYGLAFPGYNLIAKKMLKLRLTPSSN